MHKVNFLLLLIVIMFHLIAGACVLGSLTPTPNSPFSIIDFPGFLTFTVRPDQGDFLSVIRAENVIETYANNEGNLTLSSSLVTNEKPQSITYSPTAAYAAVTYSGNTSVEAGKLTIYKVSPVDGSFTQFTNLNLNFSLLPLGASFSFDGNYIAVSFSVAPLNYFALIIYSFDQTTGALNQVADNYEVAIPAQAIVAAFSPNSFFLAAPTDPSASSPGVRIYSFNPVAETLAAISGSPFSTGQTTPTQKCAYSPDGNFLAAINLNLVNPAVGVIFSVNQMTGALTLAGSTFNNGVQPRGIAYTSDGLFAAVADQSGNTIYMYSVDSMTGQFTPVTGSPFSGAQFPSQIAISQNNKILAANNLLVTTPRVSTLAITSSPTVTISPSNQTACIGSSVTFDSQVTDSAAPFIYAWSGPNGFSATSSSIILTNVQLTDAGAYSLIVTDSNGCVSLPQSANLLVTALPMAVATPASQIICGGTATFIASGGTSYAWTGPNGFTANTAIITPSDTGIYTVTVTDDATSCSDNAQVSLINSLPEIVINPISATVCLGSTVLLAASVTSGIPPFTYAWSDGSEIISDQSTVTVTPTNLGIHIYTVTVTSADGCMNSITASVIVNPIPTVVVTASATTINAGETITLTSTPTATDPYELHWSDGFIQSVLSGVSIRTVSPITSTNYSVIISDATGCASDPIIAANIIVTEPPIINSLAQAVIAKYC